MSSLRAVNTLLVVSTLLLLAGCASESMAPETRAGRVRDASWKSHQRRGVAKPGSERHRELGHVAGG